jgi:hypothetical protein
LEVEKAYRRNDARKFYKDIKQFSGDYAQHMMICRDKEGKMLYDKKIYFGEMEGIFQ